PLNGSPAAGNPCTWNFYVTVNNPGAVAITYEWDFDVGATPALTATTSVPNASVTYTNGGMKTVRVRLKAGNCTDVRTATFTIDCGGAPPPPPPPPEPPPPPP